MILVLDFGSQTSQLIARRLREARIECRLHPWDTPAEELLAERPLGFIFSGGPASVYEDGAPFIQPAILTSGLPILGICYGMQALTHALGGQVAASAQREYGRATLTPIAPNPLLPADPQPVWMSHGDRIEMQPPGFHPIAASDNAPIAAMADADGRRFGLQFHPEVHHTPGGAEILRRFAVEICAAPPTWTPAAIIENSVAAIQAQVGKQRVLAALSGGVDSSVAAALVQKAVGDQLIAVFIDNGLLRAGERAAVMQSLQQGQNLELITVDAADDFLGALAGVADPEQKRLIIGERFIRHFEEQ
ncbi:MAG: glutamine-hydrolyzing GMP synthase, partial [Chloroflexi bacterium]|nr:glutamine-hydrolyzing GMP synthase [Chloroflexota bacterium]